MFSSDYNRIMNMSTADKINVQWSGNGRQRCHMQLIFMVSSMPIRRIWRKTLFGAKIITFDFPRLKFMFELGYQAEIGLLEHAREMTLGRLIELEPYWGHAPYRTEHLLPSLISKHWLLYIHFKSEEKY